MGTQCNALNNGGQEQDKQRLIGIGFAARCVVTMSSTKSFSSQKLQLCSISIDSPSVSPRVSTWQNSLASNSSALIAPEPRLALFGSPLVNAHLFIQPSLLFANCAELPHALTQAEDVAFPPLHHCFQPDCLIRIIPLLRNSLLFPEKQQTHHDKSNHVHT